MARRRRPRRHRSLQRPRGPSRKITTLNPPPTTPAPAAPKPRSSCCPASATRPARWEQPPAGLSKLDAGKTTLILTSPYLPVKGLKPIQQQLDEFLKRGGTILATGANGAKLLPGGVTNTPTRIYSGLCSTAPEGPRPLARAGQVTVDVPVAGITPTPSSRSPSAAATTPSSSPTPSAPVAQSGGPAPPPRQRGPR